MSACATSPFGEQFPINHTSASGNAAHSSFASSAAANHATAIQGRPVIHASSDAKHSSAASTMLRPQT